ncbi:unnamed protein product [Rotaria sp. Silwood2]|nr:unnamed protein product [Rotaria sp. Silwood2]CAF4461260.1 unnamed protein product [Rotaria sp. Silwood2]
MALLAIVGATIQVTMRAYQIVAVVRDSEGINDESKQALRLLESDLKTAQDTLDHLNYTARRVSGNDEKSLIGITNTLQSAIADTERTFDDVKDGLTFLDHLLKKNKETLQRIRQMSDTLNNARRRVEDRLPHIPRITINEHILPDFRQTYCDVPDKELSLYDFSFKTNTRPSIVEIATEQFNTTKFSFYMKVNTEQTILSYHLRTWTALNLKSFVPTDLCPSILNSESTTSTDSLSSLPSAPLAAATIDTNNIHRSLDFSQFLMLHDYICGIASTHNFIYIATKYEITIISLGKKRETKARFGAEGDGPNRFKHISHLYIPSNDETNLYIVDCGQQCVHQYKIDDTGHGLTHVHQYFIITNVPQRYNLVSCVIFNDWLYVSDDANNCLHIFSLKAERQSHYLVHRLIPRFSPGSLCVHDKYLYVSDRSVQSPGIVVFDEQCIIVDWFRNPMIKEILAMDIDPSMNKLYILTTTQDENDNKRKRPMIVSMDLLVRPQK